MSSDYISQCPLCLKIVDWYSMMIIDNFGAVCPTCHKFHEFHKTPLWGIRKITELVRNERLWDVSTMNPNTKNGNDSVTKGLVYFGFPRNRTKYTLKSVCCIAHGAMLAVSKLREGGMLYRCEVCNNGAIRK